MTKEELAPLQALPRYTLLHCNDMGEDYMSRCYMVAKPDNGGEEVMAGKYQWIRAADLDTVVARLRPQPIENKEEDDSTAEKPPGAVTADERTDGDCPVGPRHQHTWDGDQCVHCALLTSEVERLR